MAAVLEDVEGVSEAINLGDLLPSDQDRNPNPKPQTPNPKPHDILNISNYNILKIINYLSYFTSSINLKTIKIFRNIDRVSMQLLKLL